MKYIKIITIFLMMALAISPALAANCATACASKAVMSAVISTINHDDMANMVNCHEDAAQQDSTSKAHSKTTHHQPCAMGAGCHFAQATPTDSSAQLTFLASNSASFLQFDASAHSVDPSPPLKPPA